MKNLIFMVTVAIIIMLGFQSISAQKNNIKMAKNDRCHKKLNLTEAQKIKFKEIKFNHQEAKIDIEAKIKKNQLKTRRIKTEDNIDEDMLMKLIDKRGELKTDLIKSKTRMWLDIRNILDSEQRKIWAINSNFMCKKNRRFSNTNRKNFNPRDGHRKFEREFK